MESKMSIFIMMLGLKIVMGSHFRGGIIQWRPLNAQNFDGRIEITHRIAWRRSSGGVLCTTADIGSTRLFGSGTLFCSSGCSGTVGTMSFYCTDFSATEDWVAGERTYVYNIGTSSSFIATYSSCCWISLNVGGGGWSVRVSGNLGRRSDNGRVNSSPLTSTTPIVRLQQGCTHTLRIPVQDPDRDVVRCRWASGSSECSGVCRTLPGAVLDSNTCTLSWTTASRSAGWYGAAFQVEDFISSSSTTPMSSVPLQFLINLFSSSQPCTGGIQPSLVAVETPPDGSCIAVPFGTTYTAGIVAASGGSSVSIVDFPTSSPLGLRKSSVTRSTYNTQHYYINVTWTPTTSQSGINIFCFSARSSNNLVSNRSCITLLGGVTGPQASQSSVSPIGRFSPTSSTTWSITFDQAISRPSSRRYIRFYEQMSRRLVYSFDVTSSSATYPAAGSGGRVLTFRISHSFSTGLAHYILIDSGVAVGTMFCNQESIAVTSTSFWTFTTGCQNGYMESGSTCVDINECSTGMFTCQSNSRCVNTPGGYRCDCNSGFELSGSTCRDINECSRGTDRCDAIATCTNTIGSYQCACPSGTLGNGFTCTDACNECLGTPANCGTHNCNTTTSDCTNTVGSFQCTCRFGLASDGVTCAPPPRPDPPMSVRISSTGTTTITIVWVAPTPSIRNRISKYNLVLTSSVGDTITRSTSGTSFTFTGLQEYRTYTCVIRAVSIYGPISVATPSVSTTTLQTAPTAPPENFNAVPTSSRSANITWAPPPLDEQNGVIISYVINVTVVGTGRTFQLTSTTITLTVNSLTPYTTFICIIAAVTSPGIGPFSSRFTLVTPQDAPSSPPQNVRLAPISSSSINISWSPPPAGGQNGVITQYRINITEVITGRVITFTSTTTSITARGLHPYYMYECVISAFTIGVGPYSRAIRITTPEDVPSGSPLNFTGRAISSRSATISWNPPPADQQNGVIIRYVINVTVVESGRSFQLTSNMTSLTVSSLLPYRNYICIIAAMTSVGIGPFSSRFTLVTPQDVPTMAPENPSAVVRNSKAIFCTWDPPPQDHQNGVIVEYRINVTEVITGRVFVRLSTVTSLEITSLHPDYEYQWVVTAVTVGVGPYTSVVTIRTPEDVPSGPPQSPSMSFVNARSIGITWQPPSLPDRNGVITGYVINITSLDTGTRTQLTSTTTNLTIPNLAPYTSYVCIIAARTAVGLGPFSTVVTVRTLEAAPGTHPSNFTGMSLNSTHIYLTWQPPPPSQVNGVIREYRLNITEDVTGMVFQYTTPPNDRQITIGPLHPYYVYHCSVVALTIQLGPYTSVFTIQTEEDIPSGPPTSFITNATDSRTIILSWGAPQADEQNGILRYYLVTLTSVLPTETRNISSSQFSITISNLRPYTTYNCTVRGGTVGIGPPTIVQQILTPEDVPTGPPQNFTLMANNSRSLILSWAPPLPQDINGIIIDYTINVTSSSSSSFRVGSGVTTYTLASLRPYVAYTCIIAAHTSVGQGPFGTNVTLTTPEDAPEAPPVMLSRSNVMSRSVYLSWVAPHRDRHNGIIRYYIIEAYENDTGNTLTYQTLSDQTSFAVGNLHPYYTYSVRIQAVTVSSGPLSLALTVNTLQDIPTAAPVMPSGYPVVGSASLIRLMWSPLPPEHVNGIIAFYLVEVTEVVTNTTYTFHAVRTNINIGPLHPFYTYRCRVAAFTIGIGPFTPFFYVTSGETLPSGAPSNLTAPRTTTNSLSLSWDPPRFDLQNGVIRYYIIYITDVTNNTSWEATSNTTRITIYDLQPFFFYNCSVAAFTVGVGPISDPLVIRLPQAAPGLAPTNLRGFAIDHSRISLEWDAPPINSFNGILSAYVVNVTERETGFTFEINTTNTSITLTALHPDYVYECRVAAYTIATGPFSVVFAVQVRMAAPSSPPENITVTVFSSRSMHVTWDPPIPQFRNGPILAYNLTVTELNTGFIVQSSVVLGSYATVLSLRPFTPYNFTLSARTSVGYGPSDTISEITPEDTSSAPTSPVASAVAGLPYSLFVTWMPPSMPNGIITHYNVYCQEAQFVVGLGSGDGMFILPKTPSQLTFTSTVQGYELNATITGLTPFTDYGCYVSANTSVGEGNFSVTVFETTDEYIPSDPPMNVQAYLVNATSVFLSWSPPLVPHGIILSYTILVEEDLIGGNVTSLIANATLGTSFTVVDLIPYTFYNFTIAASTRIGTGPPSNTVSMRTPQASPYGTPRSVRTSVTGTTTANISWVSPDPSLQNGIILYYTVVLADLMLGMPDRVYNTTQTSFSFTGLEEYGRYGCRVAAATIGGPGPLSTSVQFITFEDIPTAPPQNVNGTALGSSLIMLHWSPPPPLELNGAIRYYTVNAIERYTGRQWTFFAIDTDLHIGSLHPYYFYDFNVSATTIGRGPFSSTHSVLTDPEPPTAAPEQLSANRTSTSIMFTWNPPPFEDTNGPIQYYMVRVTELDTNTVFAPRTSTTMHITFNNLHPYYFYRCTVAAYTIGIGPYTLPITIQLAQEAPTAPPLDLSGFARNSDSISLSWTPPLLTERNGIIQYYFVNATEEDTGNMYSHVSLNTNFTLFSLHPYYTYMITVSAVTVAPGPATSPITIRTDQDVPSGPAQGINITVISSEEVLIMWEAPDISDQNGIITGYVINVTRVSTGQNFQMTSTAANLYLNNLLPFTSYMCRVAAMTNVGVGPYSIPTSFLTAGTAPSSPPENLNVTSVSSTSIRLSWTPPPAAVQNGIITEYRINVTEVDTGRLLFYTSFTTSFVVQGLHPYYMYECRVSAYTVAVGPLSDPEVIQTPEDIPSGYPQMFMESVDSSRSVTFRWSAPLVEEQNGVIISYTLNITEAGSGQITQRTVPSSQTSVTVSSLLPFTTYFCSIAASTSVNRGPFSPTLTVNTLEDSPNMSPSNLTGSALDPNTISLSWNQPSGRHNGIIREYRLNITEVETGLVLQEVSATTTLVVSNLHPDYTYNWIVTAFTVGEGPYSITSSVTIPEDAPRGPPTSITATALSPTSILLNWNLPLPEDRNGDITGYVINVTNLDNGTVLQFTTGLVSNFTLSNLKPFTVYISTISARTAVGVGPFSGVIDVQILEDAPGSHPLNSTGYSLNSTHIFLDWSTPLQQDINGIIREYRINVTEGETGVLQQLTTVPTVTEIVVGPLHPFYIYHCTILAYTVEGGPNTTVISIRTEEDAPSGPPTSVRASPMSARSVSMSWGPPIRNQQNGIVRHYLISLRSLAETVTRNISSTQQSIIISGLRPYTMYNCTVQAETVGLGPPNAIIQINTPQDVPTGTPQNVRAVATDPTTLSISWSPPLPAHRNGLIQRYTINITELETRTALQFFTTNQSISIPGRHPFYRYSYFVAAETIGQGPFSVASVIQMPQSGPTSPPENVVISSVTSSSFLISWNAPPAVDHNGIIQNYAINITEENTGRVIQLTSNTNSQRVESLRPFYNYTCVVAAVTVEAGVFSTPITFTTAEDVPTGPPLNFVAIANSSTSMILTWEAPLIYERNGIIISYTVILVSGGNSSTFVTPDETLTLRRLRPFTSYMVTVSASTSVGSGPSTATITVTTPEYVPEGAPINVVSSDVTSTSLTLTWGPPQNTLQNGVIRHYIITALEINTGTNFNYQAQSRTTFSIGDLHPFYTYQFNVFAVTVEVGPSSLDHRVTTLQDVPTSSPQNITESAVDSSTLSITWTPPPLDSQNGIITQYVVNISVLETGEQFQRMTVGTATSLSVGSLHPDYTYSYIMAARTSVGTGTFSLPCSIKMPEDAPSSSPLNQAGRAVNSTSIIVTWDHPAPDGRNGIITGYSLILVEVVTNVTTTYRRIGAHLELVIGSLHPFYDYECVIAAETRVGRGPYGQPFIITTSPDVPNGLPLNIGVVAMDSRTIQVTWDPPLAEERNGVIQRYLVVVMVRQTLTSLSLNATSTSLTLPDLHPAYDYSIEVAAVTIGVGPFSAAISVTTPADAPTGPPLSVTAVTVSSTSVRISWDAPILELQNGQITSYRIYVTELETGLLRTFSTVPTDRVYVVNSLHPFYFYNCSVAAFTNGLGPSTTSVVQMLPEEPSEAPIRVSVTAINATSVLVTWASPPPEDRNGIIQGFTVRVVGTHTGEDFRVTINSTETTVGNLHPFYSYKFTVAAVTIAHGPFSNPITLMMPPLAPTSPVANLTAEELSPTAVRLRWLPPSQDEWNGIITRYTIEYELLRPVGDDDDDEMDPTPIMTFTSYVPSSHQSLNNNLDPTLAISPLVWEELQINGLQEYYVYTFSIYYENSAGRSVSSFDVELDMPPAAPSGPPTAVTVSAQSESSIRVQWSPPEVFEQNGPIASYIVNLTYSNRTSRMYTLLGNTYNIQIEGLPKFADLNITVAARTSTGLGPSSQPVSVKTFESVPDRPVALQGTTVSKNNVQLSWSPPTNPNGVIREYQVIYYGSKEEDTSNRIQQAVVIFHGPYVVLVPATQTTYLVEDLRNGLTYSFTIRARTNPGFGANSTALLIKITDDVAGTSGVSGGVTSTVSAAIVLAVIGWILLMIVIVIVVAIYICRKKKYRKSLGSHVGGTNFYEQSNPVTVEMDESYYNEVKREPITGDENPAAMKNANHEFSDHCDDDEPMKLDLAAQAKEKRIEGGRGEEEGEEVDNELAHLDPHLNLF